MVPIWVISGFDDVRSVLLISVFGAEKKKLINLWLVFRGRFIALLLIYLVFGDIEN